MQWWWQEVGAHETGGNDYRDSGTIDNINAAPYVVAYCSLAKYNANGTPSNAQVYINQYVQHGNPHDGNWQMISGTGVTSVSVTLLVNNATAQGLLLVAAVSE